MFFIDAFYQQLSYRTVEEGYGQLVLWRQAREAVTQRSVEEIARMSFEDFAFLSEGLRLAPFESILAEVRAQIDRS